MENQTILVVEDEALIRFDLVDNINSYGFATLEAGSADEALSILEQHRVCCVWTDIQMPGSMNGLELAHIVRERLPEAAIIISSGNENPPAEELPDGAKFVPKPIQLDHLKELLPSDS